MDLIRRLYVRLSEKPRGQTMNEYALIVAVIAIVIFGSYKTIGMTVQNVVNNVVALL